MASKFWASSEDMSTDSNAANDSSNRKSHDQSADEDIPRDVTDEGAEQALARPVSSGGTVARAITSTRIPSLQPAQHANLFYLSLIEGKCKEQAKTTLNKTRPPNQQLSENDPEVCSLAESLYHDMKAELLKAGMIPEEFANQDHNELPQLPQYLNIFDRILTNLASAKTNEVLGSPGFKVIEDTRPLGIAEDFSPSEESKALVLFGETAVAPRPPISTVLSMLYQEGTSKLGQSEYTKYYTELSCLGKGGYGSVYKAQHRLDKGIYAIKRIKVSMRKLRRLAATNTLETALNEVISMAGLSHPHIVNYQHCWLETSIPHLVAPAKKVGLVNGIESLSLNSSKPEPSLSGASFIHFSDSNSHSVSRAGLVHSKNAKSSLAEFPDIQFGYSENNSKPENPEIQFRYSDNTSYQEVPEIQPGYSDNSSMAGKYKQSTSGSSSSDSDDDEESQLLPSAINMDACLYIKMAHYPLSLEDFIWSSQQKCPPPLQIKHCYHTGPTLRLLYGIVDGLEYLHKRSIIHRDMKPGNVFLSILDEKDRPMPGYINIYDCAECIAEGKNGRKWINPCIGDFGLATLREGPNTKQPPSSNSESGSYNAETETDVLAQKPLWPKQAGTTLYLPNTVEEVSEKLDIYALGIIAFELSYKFDTKQERFNVLTSIKRFATFPADWEERAGEALREGIRGMVCQNKEERWTLGQVREWLEGLL